MPARVAYFTDPASPDCWGIEPALLRLMTEFGEDLSWTFVMSGLGRSIEPAEHGALALDWLAAAEASRMPFDPLIWRVAPLKSNYPAAMAVKAAADQGGDVAGFLRRLRIGIMCLRRKLDTVDALVEVAREAGLDADRFRLDLSSNAVVEAFGNDLERARDVPEEARAAGHVETATGRERVTLPTLVFSGEDGARNAVYGAAAFEDYSKVALAAGAEASGAGPLGVTEALRRFGRLATREVEEICALRGPRAEAELWRLALEFEVRPLRAGTGWLWEPA